MDAAVLKYLGHMGKPVGECELSLSAGFAGAANVAWAYVESELYLLEELDDAGTMRSGWAIPGNLLISGKSWKANRIDRSISANSVPQNLAIYGVYNLPFGKGGIGNDSWLVRNLAGGWTFSSVFTYISGTPLLITSSYCTSSFQPTAGTCMPDLNPNYHRKDDSHEWKLG